MLETPGTLVQRGPAERGLPDECAQVTRSAGRRGSGRRAAGSVGVT